MRSPAQPAFAALCVILCSCTSYPAPRGDQPAYAGHVLRGGDCLDPQMARSWTDLGDGVLLVDAGRFKYRMQLSGGCEIIGPVLWFRGGPISGRVCGGGGDAVITRDYTCAIRDMQLLDKEQYRELIEARDSRRKRGSD